MSEFFKQDLDKLAFFQSCTRYVDIFFGQALDFFEKFAKFLISVRDLFSLHNTHLRPVLGSFRKKLRKIDEGLVVEFSNLAKTSKSYIFPLKSFPQPCTLWNFKHSRYIGIRAWIGGVDLGFGLFGFSDFRKLVFLDHRNFGEISLHSHFYFISKVQFCQIIHGAQFFLN